MIYRILRHLARLAFKSYFRKIYLLDVEALPRRGATLVTCNHPGAFLEASILGAFIPRPLHYLTRGDFFINKVVNWLLRQTHQIPIYRTRDGFSNLRSNRETLSQCSSALREGKAIVIFPEARTVLEKRLRPVQRGAARIVFGTRETYPDTHTVIVPIGVTLIDPLRPGRDVFVQIGQPVPADSYDQLYASDAQEALRILTNHIETAMRNLMIHFDDHERERLFDDVVAITDEVPSMFPRVSQDNRQFVALQSLAKAMNLAVDEDIVPIHRQVEEIAAMLKTCRLPVRCFAYPGIRYSRLAGFCMVPLLLIEYIAGAVPRIVTEGLVGRIQALPFKGAVRSTAGFLIHGSFYGLLMIAGYILFGWPGVLIAGALAMLGYFSYTVLGRPALTDWIRWSLVPAKERKKLFARRDTLRRTLNNLYRNAHAV